MIVLWSEVDSSIADLRLGLNLKETVVEMTFLHLPDSAYDMHTTEDRSDWAVRHQNTDAICHHRAEG